MNKLFFVFFFFVFYILLNSCNNEKKQLDFSRYISYYTHDPIKSKSSITIVLENAITMSPVNSTLSSDILSCSPRIAGTLTLKDEHTLIFTPESPLKNDKTYKVTLHLNKLYDNIPEQFEDFTFDVSVVFLTGHFSNSNLSPELNDSTQKYQGCITSTDYVAEDEVEDWVTMSIDNQIMTPQWKHEGNVHTFFLTNITRTENDQLLKLSFAEHLNTKDFELEIPSKNKLSVLNIQSSTTEEKCILIYFSNPLDAKQKASGFISIENATVTNCKIENNCIRVVYQISKTNDILKLHISEGLKSINGNTLLNEFIYNVPIENPKPEVKFIGNGVVMANEGKNIIPFSAIAIEYVDVTIRKVYDQNMVFHLQENDFDNQWDFDRTAGTIVYQQKINLRSPSLNLNQWNDFSIDLSNFTNIEKGVLYNIELSFKRSYTTIYKDPEHIEGEDEPLYYTIEDWWNYENDPYSYAYSYYRYGRSRNFINTSLGVIAKIADSGSCLIAVNDLQTTKAISGCKVVLYDYYNQRIDSAETNSDGFATINHKDGFIIKVQKDDDKAWLKLQDPLSLSNFDVSGQKNTNGLKGFIYSERGVWRPGDDLHISFILNDKQNPLPEGHPIVATLYNPTGTAIAIRRSVVSQSPIHTFNFKTEEDAITGFWNIKVKVGGSTFSKSIRIETIKPNRMSIKMNLPENNVIGEGSDSKFEVNTRWLSGVLAPGRHATTEISLNKCQKPFIDYPEYSFVTSQHFETSTTELFNGTTDENGNYSVSLANIEVSNAPGLLSAILTTRLDEIGGDFSISSEQAYYSPYSHYLGIKLPGSEDGWLPLNTDLTLQGVVLTPNGKKSADSRDISIQIYRTDWHWWWDSYNDEEYYTYKESSSAIFNERVSSSNGTFSTTFNIKEYGRYIIVATDEDGHSCSSVGWFGSWSDYQNPDASTIMILDCDKKQCNVGETFTVQFPSEKGNSAIITLENGNSILSKRRLETGDGKTTIEFTATEEMMPNVYVSVSLIQPQAVRANDRPIRLFGIQNITINDKETILKPVIKTASEIRANDLFSLSVKEENGKPMTYTIAIVDEGLLALTSFKTPNPYNSFFAREALGIKTFDFYNYIFGAYGARLEQAFAAGGDEFIGTPEDKNKNRFSSVVLFEGPFSIKPGETAKHTFKMPQYIGEVRTMVVAATKDGRYGSTSVQTHVTKPLMVSLTAPRTFSPGDQFVVPVSLLSTDKGLKETTVSLKTDNKLEIIGENPKKVQFNGKSEQFAFFTVKAKNEIGKTTLTVSAECYNENDQKSITAEIRIPNPPIFHVETKIIKSGETTKIADKFDGLNPSARIELTSIPPLNLSQRLTELLEYPHGCAEQIVSGAFPQLMLNTLVDLNTQQRALSENHVISVINRLPNYQTSEGAIALWQGSVYPNEWASVYAAHFLTYAKNTGYDISNEMYTKLISYLQNQSSNYRANDHSDILQAYRLYVLSTAGKNKNGDMNRLRESLKKSQSKDPSARYLLAAAYATCGYEKYAQNTLDLTNSKDTLYDYYSNYYGSRTRCHSFMLITMSLLNRQDEAFNLLSQISEDMSSNRWMSTQSMSFSMLAAATYVKTFIGNQATFPNVTLKIGNETEKVESNNTVIQREVQIRDNSYNVEVTNHDSCNVILQVITSHSPINPNVQAVAKGLNIDIKWFDKNGTTLSLSNLKQGSEIYAEINVSNKSAIDDIENIALSFMASSGFEIINERLNGNVNAYKEADNVDIRDDRFYMYFALKRNQSKTFRLRMNAAFAGDFILPAISCYDMYNTNIQAITPGCRVKIIGN